jgi:hypothetical protein
MKTPDIVGLILERTEQEIQDEWRPARIPGSYRGSELGDCTRALQYANLGYKPESIDPRLALLFRDGHLHHEALRTELAKIGRLTNVEQPAWKRYVVEYNGENIPIIITTTCDLHFDGTYVGELKGITTFSFKGLKSNDDVRSKYPHYVGQLNTYLDVYGKKKGFLLFKDKNSSALRIFWFDFDQALLDETLQKLAKIEVMSAKKKLIKRPFKKSSWDCKSCQFRQKCWGKPRQEMVWR